MNQYDDRAGCALLLVIGGFFGLGCYGLWTLACDIFHALCK